MKKLLHAVSLAIILIAAVPAAAGVFLLWCAVRIGDWLVSLAERSENEGKA